MKTIWKYPLELTDTQTLQMPEGAKILTVQIQGGSPCLWAMVDSAATKRDRIIEIIGTGNPTEAAPRQYIGTVQMIYAGLVWHVFEKL